jgi:hypothetical protein
MFFSLDVDQLASRLRRESDYPHVTANHLALNLPLKVWETVTRRTSV